MGKITIERANNILVELIETYGGIVGYEFEGEEHLFEFFERGSYPIDLDEEISASLEIDSNFLDITENTKIKDIWNVLEE